MIKFKAKSIENVAERAKERMLGKTGEGVRIGILVSSDNFSGGRNYSMKLAYNVQNAILKTGFETEIITLPTLCDNYKEYTSENNFINIYKEQLASMVELLLTEKSYDGLVIIPKGISSKVGMLRGAFRLNLPTLVLTEGPSSCQNGATLKDLTLLAGLVAKGKASSFDMQTTENTQIEYVGDGADFNSSNIINIILEVMGLSIMGNSTTFASTITRENLAEVTAKTIVSLTKDRFSPRKLITKKVISNAIITNFALGGSTVALNSILELARELDIDMPFDKALALQKGVPTLYDTSSKNMTNYAEDGGTAALLKALSGLKLLDENSKTYANRTLDEALKTIKDTGAFEKCSKESLTELHGNLIDRRGLAKALNIAGKEVINGKARVFDCDDSASYAVLAKSIKPETIIVIKNGSNSCGGGNIPYQTVRALEAFDLLDSVVVLTESDIPDGTKAMVIGNILPNGDDGALRIVQDDDEIEVDFNKGRVNIDLNNKEISQRQRKFVKDHKQLPTFVKQYIKLTENK